VWSDEFTNLTGREAAKPFDLDLRYGWRRMGKQGARDVLRLGLERLAVQLGEPQRVCRHGRFSAHRRAEDILGRVHVGAAQDAGALQFSLWTAGVQGEGA
jgi:hypothetical protein